MVKINIQNLFLKLLAFIFCFGLFGCSHLQSMKECNDVVDSSGEPTGYYLCKTLKPWE